MDTTPAEAPPGSAAPGATAPRRSPLAALRHEVDRLFDEVGWSWGGDRLGSLDMIPEALAAGLRGLAALDVVERPDAYEVQVELPGMRPEDLELRVGDGRLTLRGERRDARDEARPGYRLRERGSGLVARSLRLPEDVAADRVAARLADGVLTVTLPRLPRPAPASRRIEIAAG